VGEGGVFDAFDVTSPMKGEWAMEAEGTGKLQLTALLSSPVTLRLPTAYSPGGEKVGVALTLSAAFVDQTLIRNAEVLLRVGSTPFAADVEVVMMTRKKSPKTGHEYEAAFTPPSRGTYCFTAVAKGITSKGETFLRQAGGWCAVAQ